MASGFMHVQFRCGRIEWTLVRILHKHRHICLCGVLLLLTGKCVSVLCVSMCGIILYMVFSEKTQIIAFNQDTLSISKFCDAWRPPKLLLWQELTNAHVLHLRVYYAQTNEFPDFSMCVFFFVYRDRFLWMQFQPKSKSKRGIYSLLSPALARFNLFDLHFCYYYQLFWLGHLLYVPMIFWTPASTMYWPE